jgi:hypothetical protein
MSVPIGQWNPRHQHRYHDLVTRLGALNKGSTLTYFRYRQIRNPLSDLIKAIDETGKRFLIREGNLCGQKISFHVTAL